MVIDFNERQNKHYTTHDYEENIKDLDDYVSTLNKILNLTEYAANSQYASDDFKNKIYLCYRRLLSSVASSKYRNDKSVNKIFDDAMKDLEELLKTKVTEEELLNLSFDEIVKKLS